MTTLPPAAHSLLCDLLEEVSAASDVKRALAPLCRRARRAINADMVAVFLSNEDGEHHLSLAAQSGGEEHPLPGPLLASFAGVSEHRPLQLHTHQSELEVIHETLTHLGVDPTIKWILIPLEARRRCLGFLLVAGGEAWAHATEFGTFPRRLGRALARGLARTREADRRAQELSTYYHLSLSLGAATDLPQLLSAATTTLTEQLGLDAVAIWSCEGGALSTATCLVRLGMPRDWNADAFLTGPRVRRMTRQPGLPIRLSEIELELHERADAMLVCLHTGEQPAGVLLALAHGRPLPDLAQRLLFRMARGLAQTLEHRMMQERIEQARERAELADGAKARFVQVMAHELRTPLNGVVGMLDQLQASPLGRREQSLLSTASQCADQLTRLVDDVMTFAGRAQRNNNERLVSFAPDAIVQRALDQHESTDVIGGLVMGERLPLSLRGDAHAFSRVVEHLVSNAFKFTTSGHVVVTLQVGERRDDEIRLRMLVEDTGIGISEADQRKIFTEFTQAESGMNRQRDGAGLGLAVIRQLLQKTGGTISLKSQPNQGSVFTVDIWVKHDTDVCHASPIRGTTTLLVGEEDTELAIVERQLEAAGVAVARASTVMRADAMLARMKISNVLDLRCDREDNGVGATATIPVVVRAIPGSASAHPTVQVPLVLPSYIRALDADAHPKKQAPTILPTAAPVPRDTNRQPPRAPAPRQAPPPRRAAPEPRHSPPVRSAIPPQRKTTTDHPLQVLVVDDVELNLRITSMALKSMGMVAHTALDGAKAVAAAKHTRFDAILMDLQMPVMDGFEAARAIRDHYGPAVPIIALTANVEEQARALSSGMNLVLPKPLNRQQLRAALEKFAAAA